MTDLIEPVRADSPIGLEPVPHPECDVCASLGRQREEARRRRDMSAVVDCNVEIRRHPHKRRRRSS